MFVLKVPEVKTTRVNIAMNRIEITYLSFRKIMDNSTRERNLKLFFAISLLCLFVQFYVSVNRTKFYPAVVMPMFGYGKFDMQNIPTVEPRVVVHFKDGDIASYDHHALLAGMPKPIRATSTHWVLENEQQHLQQDTTFTNWLSGKIYHLSGRKDIEWVDFYKIEKRYSFNDSISVAETKRTMVQHITL